MTTHTYKDLFKEETEYEDIIGDWINKKSKQRKITFTDFLTPGLGPLKIAGSVMFGLVSLGALGYSFMDHGEEEDFCECRRIIEV